MTRMLLQVWGAVVLVSLPWQSIRAIEPQDPALGKYSLDSAYYKTLVEGGFLPTKPHISDFELAEKLKLELPELANVKAAVTTAERQARADRQAGKSTKTDTDRDAR